MKKQKKLSGVVKKKRVKKAKPTQLIDRSVPDGLPGQEDVLLDQVAVKNHPEYPDLE